MREVEVPLSRTVAADEVERAVERACHELGLRIGLCAGLARDPGSLHWHSRRDSERGTLEITFVPEADRLWLAVHAGRGLAGLLRQ